MRGRWRREVEEGGAGVTCRVRGVQFAGGLRLERGLAVWMETMELVTRENGLLRGKLDLFILIKKYIIII